MAERFKIDTLNTSYVNLAAFIRYLRENQFHGRLHIEMEDYEGDVFLYGADAPSAWEIERTTGREEQGDAAMQRLLVRSRDPGGVITVFEDASSSASTSVPGAAQLPDSAPYQQATGVTSPSQTLDESASTSVPGVAQLPDSAPYQQATGVTSPSLQPEVQAISQPSDSILHGQATSSNDFSPAPTFSVTDVVPITLEPVSDSASSVVVAVASKLIAAVERAASIEGFDFSSAFNAARVEFGDDYPFIDPTSSDFDYEAGVVKRDSPPQQSVFEHGVIAVLRKTVDSLARKSDATRFRELVAAEFAIVARSVEIPEGFKKQLDRIAGTRVL